MTLACTNRRPEDVVIQAVVIPELELCDIEREVFGAHLVEGSDHPSLHERPEAFDGLSVDRADDVLATRVIDGAVEIAVASELLIGGVLIGADHGDLGRHGFLDEASEGRIGGVLDHAGDYVPLTLDRARDDLFPGLGVAGEALAFVEMPVLGFATDESLVDLYDPHEPLEFFVRQAAPDAMAHAPSRLVGTETHHPLNLEGRNALFAGHHHMDDAKPVTKGLIRVLEDRPGDMGETIGAALATIGALPLKFHGRQRVDVATIAAGATHPIGPAVHNQIRRAATFVREHLLELWDGHLMDAHIGLSEPVRAI